MAKLNIKDMVKNAGSGEFEPLPVGKYECFVFELEAKDSQAGNPMITATLKVATGEHKGRRLWVHCALTPTAWWKFQELLTACEYDVDNLPDEVDTKEELLAAVKEDLLGSKILATVVHQPYNGKMTESVSKMVPGDFETDEDFGIDDDDDLPF